MTPMGLNRSTNGGDHWTRPFTFSVATSRASMIVAQNGNIVFACDSGIYVTTDGGETVRKTYVAGSITDKHFQFAISGSGRIFTARTTGTFCSDDHGLTWRKADKDIPIHLLATYGIAASHDSVFSVRESRLYMSTNNGEDWPLFGSPVYQGFRLTILRDGSRVMLTSAGVYLNRGETIGGHWESLTNAQINSTAEFTSFDKMHDGRVFVGMSNGRIYTSIDLVDWELIYSGLEGSKAVKRVVSYRKDNTYYVATGLGVFKNRYPLSVNATQSRNFLQLFPNPLTSSAIISFSLDAPSEVVMRIADHLGRYLITENLRLSEGQHDVPIDMQQLPSGSYLLTFRAGSYRETRVIVVVK